LRSVRANPAVSGTVQTVEFGYCTLQNGYAFKSGWFSKTGIRLLRNANVGHGKIRWDETVFLPPERENEFKRFLLNEGDIVLTLDRPFIVTGTKVARVTAGDVPSLLLQRVGRFVERASGLSDDYLFMWINSPHFNEQIDPGRSNGVPHISSKQVEAAEIFVPVLAEQHRIVAKVKALMALCDQLETSLTAAAATRRRLLDALLAEALAPIGNRELEAAE
jgi:type I restriction enzyme S subunit